MDTIIRYANSDADIETAKGLIIDFIKELPVSVDFQDIHGELDEFPGRFESVIIAERNNEMVGVVALKDLSHYRAGYCEMKRMYVAPQARKDGVGEKLVKALLEDAQKRGYTAMVLDTLNKLEKAVRLYSRLGFEVRDAYYDNPLDDVVYMERQIAG